MKNPIFVSVFVFFITGVSSFGDVLQPQQTILDEQFIVELEELFPLPGINKCLSSLTIESGFLHANMSYVGKAYTIHNFTIVTATYCSLYAYSHFNIDLSNNKASIISSDTFPLTQNNRGNLNHDLSSVSIDGATFALEDSYVEFEKVPDDRWHVMYDDRQHLHTADRSPNEDWIGGVVSGYHHNTSTSGGAPNYNWYRIHIWDGKSGKSLLQGVNPYECIYYSLDTPNHYFYSAPVVRTCFSSDSKYYMASLINGFDYENNVARTIAHLIDVENLEFLPANRDVAFTPDSRYYVTEIEGYPSLIDANTRETIHQYNTGSAMTSCAFSEDGEKLYVACEDLQIYEFDSNLPQTGVKDWMVLE